MIRDLRELNLLLAQRNTTEESLELLRDVLYCLIDMVEQQHHRMTTHNSHHNNAEPPF